MEEMVIEFFKTYGWQLTLIACSGIVILGIPKSLHAFDKVAEKYRKYLYAGLSSLISIIAAAIYLIATQGFEWTSFGITALMIYTLNQTLYSVYENTGLRGLFQLLLGVIKSIFSKKAEAKAKVAAEDVQEETAANGTEYDDVPLE